MQTLRSFAQIYKMKSGMYLHTHSSHVGIIQQKYIFPPNPWRSQLDISSFWTYCVQEYDRFVFSWFFNGELQQNLNHDKNIPD